MFSDLLALSTMTLATSSQDGAPHAAAVYFACPDESALELYFFSDIASRHVHHLANNPRAAVAIYPECFEWQDIRGLQMSGQVQPVVASQTWERAWLAYQTKFPFVAQLKELVSRNKLFVFIPDWIRLVNNRQGLGFKQEWQR